MATKADLKDWIVAALRDLGGEATIVAVARHIWESHEADLRRSDDLFFTWQYDMRWAKQTLQDTGLLAPTPKGGDGLWRLARGRQAS